MSKALTIANELRNEISCCPEHDRMAADLSEAVLQLDESHAELLALAVESLEWHRGDKWRHSEVPSERAAWERRRDKIDAAIALAQGDAA